MSGISNYILNQKINALLGNSGGGGGVNQNLAQVLTTGDNAGGQNILNVTRTDTDVLNNDFNNNTTAPVWYNWGAVVPQVYLVATATPIADTQGNLQFIVSCKDAGFRQSFTIQVIGFNNKGVIRIINHQFESDTPIFTDVIYGDDGAGNNVIALTCGTPSATCEITFSDNIENGGGATAPISSFVPQPSAGAVVIGTTYAVIPLNNTSAGTSGNWNIVSNLSVGDNTTSTTINTNALGSVAPNTIIDVNNDINMSGNNIKLVNVTSTSVIETPFVGASLNLGSDLNTQGYIMRSLAVAPDDVIKMESSLTMLNGDIKNVTNMQCDTIVENTPGNGILVSNEMNVNNNKIINCLDPTSNQDVATKLYVDTTAGGSGVQNPMIVDLNGGGFGFTNADEFTTTAGGVINSNGDFLHDFLTGANLFTAGGDIITFNPQTSLNISSTNLGVTLVDYTQATRTLSINDSATLDCKASSVFSTQPGCTALFSGSTSFTGTNIDEVGIINNLPSQNTGMTASGVGDKIVFTTNNENVELVTSGLFVKEGDINQTTALAGGSGSAGGITITNGVKGRFFDGALAIYNPPANAIMDGRNHDFQETYNTQFSTTEFPRQTISGRMSFGVRCRVVINPTANQFISFRIIPQASQSVVNPTITYSRLCFQGNGNAPSGWENDSTTIPPNVVRTPALQVNRFLEGSELYLQARCCYPYNNEAGAVVSPLTYIVSYSGVESDTNPVSGEVVVKWDSAIPGVSKFALEVCAESVGGVTRVDEIEYFNDGMVTGALL
jgi:hypothetical protein